MLSEAARRFAALPTAAKFLLILTAALLPIGVALVWAASQGISDANNVLRTQAEEQARVATQGVESLIARNALALRIAANGRIGDSETACSNVQRSLTVTPGVAQRFELEDENGRLLRSLFERRNEADYSPVDVPLEEAEAAIRDADRVVRAVEGWLGRRPSAAGDSSTRCWARSCWSRK